MSVRQPTSLPARWARRYFTSPRARAAFLARVARRTERGRR